MPRIYVTRTVMEYMDIDIPDYVYTQAEIEKKVEAFLDNVDLDPDDSETEWEWSDDGPKPKENLCPPAPEFWLDSKFGKVATNGCLLVTERLPIPAEFDGGGIPWRQPREDASSFENQLGKGVDTMGPHLGWFSEIFKPFLTVPGLTVLSESDDAESMGYLVLSGAIVGLIMPVQRRTNAAISCFQWNQEAA